uniref:Endolytic murein transglycosylase n=1 Tax=candidate division WOR-3 bacterium TaxID=2052148 RepID=A0A7C6ED22_UNCW3
MKVFSSQTRFGSSYWAIPLGLFFSGILFVILIFSANHFEPKNRVSQFILYKDEPVRTTAYRLKEAGIIDNPTKFILLAKLFGYERKLRMGRYNLTKGLSEFSALKILSQGGRGTTLVTIPEGKTLKQIAEILEEQGICAKEDFLTICFDPNLLLGLGIKANSAEGYLFPDSYEFSIQADPKEVLIRMVKRFFAVYNSLMDSKDPASSRLSLHEIVTLASIVEAEAQLDSERPIIASVFLNRLKKRLPLQSCATVEYILKERKPRLAIKDLSIESPYNTYLHLGLPPGPICNPGRNSLLAILFPAQTEYLFFVSKGDGSHQFSKTSQEHQIATRRYQKRLQEN